MRSDLVWRHLYQITGLALAVSIIFFNRSSQPAAAQSPQGAENLETALAAEDMIRVIVTLHSAEAAARGEVSVQQITRSQDAVLEALPAEDFHVIHQYETLPGLAGEVTAAGLETLLNQPEIAAIALDLPVETTAGPNAELINADDVWQDLGLLGTGVNVAVIDTGIDATHPDLADRVIAQHCFNRAGCPPGSTDEGDNAPDENGHGTHIAGIIASRGEISPQGIAAGVNLIVVRVLGSSGTGFTSDVLAGIDWVVANQAMLEVKLINLSLGGGSYSGICDEADASTRLYAAAVGLARQAGITLFAASGNGGQPELMMAPACVSGVISVGSVYDSPLDQLRWPNCLDQNIFADQIPCSSNNSSELDLLAPGVLIESTGRGGGTAIKSGTSMSTAHATGVAALMLQANPGLSPAEIETILKETGVPLTDTRNQRVTPRLDALAAVTWAGGNELLSFSGTILLQGRTDHGGTHLYLREDSCETPPSGPPAATTAADGYFQITAPADRDYQCLQAVKAGYLMAQQALPGADWGEVTLPAGDVTGDGRINIFDLVLIAGRYRSSDLQADVNADGTVDVLDLTLVAINYRQQGPLIVGGN